LVVFGVSATARQSLSVDGQVGSGDGSAFLPGGGVFGSDEHGIHSTGDVPDGEPDERSGSGWLGGTADGGDDYPGVLDGEV